MYRVIISPKLKFLTLGVLKFLLNLAFNLRDFWIGPFGEFRGFGTPRLCKKIFLLKYLISTDIQEN